MLFEPSHRCRKRTDCDWVRFLSEVTVTTDCKLLKQLEGEAGEPRRNRTENPQIKSRIKRAKCQHFTSAECGKALHGDATQAQPRPSASRQEQRVQLGVSETVQGVTALGDWTSLSAR